MQANIFDDDDLDSGQFTPKSDQGSGREQAPTRSRNVAEKRVAPGPGDLNDPDDPNDLDGERSESRNIPELEGNLLGVTGTRSWW